MKASAVSREPRQERRWNEHGSTADRRRPVRGAGPRRIPLRLRQRLRDRGAARRAADRPQLAAEVRLRALCRAAHRLALHRAARHQRALLALPHPADGARTGAGSRKADIGLWRTAPCAEVETADRADALGPDPAPDERPVVRRGRAHHHHGGRCRQRRPAWRRTSISSPARWRTSTSTTPTASCCSCRSRAGCGSAPSSASSTSSPARSR